MRLLPPLLLLLVASCGHRPPTRQECKALAAPKAFIDRCMGGQDNGNYVGDLKCWPFSQPQRLHGVWLVLDEASEFIPNATTTPKKVENNASNIWVESNLTKPAPKLLADAPPVWPRAYVVDVEGRLSCCDAWFGHQGQYSRELVVSRIYSARQLPVHY